MDDHKCPHRILIGDSGADLDIEAHLRAHSEYPRLEYEYFRFPPDRPADDYLAKVGALLTRVESEYVLLADNDDFYDVAQLSHHVDFLNANRGYVGCRGIAVEFWLSRRGVAILNAPAGETLFGKLLPHTPLEQNAAMARIETFLHNIHTSANFLAYYSVFRTETLRDVWADVGRHLPMDIVIHEILLLLLLVSRGPMKVLPAVGYYRQLGTSQISALWWTNDNIIEKFFLNDAFCAFTRVAESVGLYRNEAEREKLMRAMAHMVGHWAAGSYRPTRAEWQRVRTSLSKLAPLYRFGRRLWFRYQQRPVDLAQIKPYVTASGITR